MSGLPDVSRRKVPSCCNCLRKEVLRYSVTRGSRVLLTNGWNFTLRLRRRGAVGRAELVTGAPANRDGQND